MLIEEEQNQRQPQSSIFYFIYPFIFVQKRKTEK